MSGYSYRLTRYPLSLLFPRQVWWVDPSQQPNTHTAAYSFPPPKVWGENRRKVGIFMNQDKDRRISEAKAVHTSKAK